jgi:hypothetical protein
MSDPDTERDAMLHRMQQARIAELERMGETSAERSERDAEALRTAWGRIRELEDVRIMYARYASKAELDMIRARGTLRLVAAFLVVSLLALITTLLFVLAR